MSVKINVNPFIIHLTGNKDVVEVNGSTVVQCLKQLVARYPETKKWLFKEEGKLNDLVDIYVNGESSYPEELRK